MEVNIKLVTKLFDTLNTIFSTNKKNKVIIMSTNSELHIPRAGVPQGSVLFHFYLIYTFQTFQNKIKMCSIPFYRRSCDYCLRIRPLSNIPWIVLKLKINGNKPEALFYTYLTSCRKIPRSQLKIINSYIPWKQPVKYFGVNIHKSLTFKSHVENSIIKCEKEFRSLYSSLR